MVQDGVVRLRRKLESIEKELQAADDAARAAGLSASSMVALQVSRATSSSHYSDPSAQVTPCGHLPVTLC